MHHHKPNTASNNDFKEKHKEEKKNEIMIAKDLINKNV
jgi:hypothetical protein